MNWWSEFENRIECDAPLGRHTWFRVGGAARFLFHPHDADDLSALVLRARSEGVPVKVLGCGANVLVSDEGFDGVVVRLDAAAFSLEKRVGTTLTVGAGVELMSLSRRCSERGLAGLEGLAGIPATVGGAVRMNAGGRFGDIGAFVSEVKLLRDDGVVERRTHDMLQFNYRQSNIGDCIVLSVVLDLKEDDPVRVLRDYNECFEYKKASQPLADQSAGCIFKNPQGRSAGALIDEAGLKGKAYGKAHVSARHANFIVADVGATASDVLSLIDIVRDEVAEKLDTRLELEIEVWQPAACFCAA